MNAVSFAVLFLTAIIAVLLITVISLVFELSRSRDKLQKLIQKQDKTNL
jgi:hypothetical protein